METKYARIDPETLVSKPVEDLHRPGICVTLTELYATLKEIELTTNYLGKTLFGVPSSELCEATPDSVEDNAHMAFNMAKFILDELQVITKRLEG